MRVIEPEVAGVSVLAERLTAALGGERISLSDDLAELDVRIPYRIARRTPIGVWQ